MPLPPLLRPMDGYCYCTYAGMEACYQAALDILRCGVPGAFVETGVANGGMAACFAKAMITAGDVRRFHLFDSFCGIPVAGPRDDCQPGLAGPKPMDDSAPLRDRLRPSGIGPAIALDEVKHNLSCIYALDTIPWVFHAGWFQDTLPTDAASIGPIALLHLDGDLYESTLVCLEWLYPLVSSGGIVIVDDYGMRGCRDAVMDYFVGQPPTMYPWSDYGAVAMRKT